MYIKIIYTILGLLIGFGDVFYVLIIKLKRRLITFRICFNLS